jgi:MoaA/NifB/PqqE/SkfB family radical SAM enzyme
MPDYSLAIDKLVERLMREQNLDPTDESAKEKFKNEALDKINRFIISRIPDDKLEQFEELLEENNADKISHFLEESLGSVQAAVEESFNY